MNQDQTKGRIEEAKGKIKEAVGRVTNNPDMEARGTAQKIGGKVEKTYGDAKEQVKKDLDDKE